MTAESYLTLGDGDFSYSLDLAQYLARTAASSSEKEAPTRANSTASLCATGIDSLDELTEKYKNIPFILRRLKDIGESTAPIEVTILQSVNAIADPPGKILSARRVIFNHPHLGVEDARLHSQFLSHLFYSVRNRWLKTNGSFHLTLASGQYERWRCEEAAIRHNFVVLDKSPFQPPPVEKPYFTYRRHQTGKSFAKRTLGASVTYTFARKDETIHGSRLPWYRDGSQLIEELYTCPFCSREFMEKRSLKNHIQSKHERKRKRDEQLLYPCIHCDKVFDCEQALHDHLQAKHHGIHQNIPADWAASLKKNDSMLEGSTNFGFCEICDCVFLAPEESSKHLSSFQPSLAMQYQSDGVLFRCTFCDKGFHEKRAQLQHENICKTRLNT